MRVLDLYAGLKGWSEPFAQRGHNVTTLDYLPEFNCDITVDILEWDYKSIPAPHIILASPPCEKFSTMGFQYGWFDQMWNRARQTWETVPMTDEADHALALVAKTVEIIRYFGPRWWVIENPKALLRSTEAIPDAWTSGVRDPKTKKMLPHSVWYCHYGEHRAKPTDLWGHFPRDLRLEPPCHNQRPEHPADCCCRDHTSAPRGSRTGTQGMNRELSAKIPFPLADSFRLAAETAFDRGDIHHMRDYADGA